MNNICKSVDDIFKELMIDREKCDDLHLLRFYSSYVAVQDGKAIAATGSCMEYCPLAAYFYRKIVKEKDKEGIKKTILEAINGKIEKFGSFTEKREIVNQNIAVPYGASELLMFAMRKKLIDASVIVCDGAGTIIVEDPDVVQGVGGRMNGLFYTSVISATIKKLKEAGCRVVFEDASINQLSGARKAAELGYKNIAVTVNASMDEDIEEIKKIEKKYDVLITSLAICTTGITEEKANELAKHVDVVWSCASESVREVIGKKAILQLSRKIPVYILTQKGLDLVSGYFLEEDYVKTLNPQKQYIVDNVKEGKKLQVGDFEAYLRESKLPVRSKSEPRLLT